MTYCKTWLQKVSLWQWWILLSLWPWVQSDKTACESISVIHPPLPFFLTTVWISRGQVDSEDTAITPYDDNQITIVTDRESIAFISLVVCMTWSAIRFNRLWVYCILISWRLPDLHYYIMCLYISSLTGGEYIVWISIIFCMTSSTICEYYRM